MDPKVEEKIQRIIQLAKQRDEIVAELYEILSQGTIIIKKGTPDVKVNPEVFRIKCKQCGKDTHEKKDCPRLLKKSASGRRCSICNSLGHRFETCPKKLQQVTPEEIYTMFKEHYLEGVSVEILIKKYNMTRTSFYTRKEKFRMTHSEEISVWVRERHNQALLGKPEGENPIKGQCKYCGQEAPPTHTVCESCESLNAVEKHDEKIIKESGISEGDVKKMVVLDLIDRMPVNEICARFKINMRTYAVLTKKWRDENPEELARWKEIDGKPKTFGSSTYVSS